MCDGPILDPKVICGPHHQKPDSVDVRTQIGDHNKPPKTDVERPDRYVQMGDK